MPSVLKPTYSCQSERDEDQVEEVEEVDPLRPVDMDGGNDFCGLCRDSSHATLSLKDDYYFGLIRKCLPLVVVNTILLTKICCECINHLTLISKFIDKIASSQNNIIKPKMHDENVYVSESIKIEPIANFEDEPKIQTEPSIQVIDFANSSIMELNSGESRLSTHMPQKKCEILEIVDIKPFHFDGALQLETYDDEDEIQILSPKQLKVELDPDDGSNELELIRNYIHQSTVFLQDHNYTLKNDENVKTEFEDDDAGESSKLTIIKICKYCNKSFVNMRKFLAHKATVHKTKNIHRCFLCFKGFVGESKLKNHRTKDCHARHKKIRKICKKIIEQRKLKSLCLLHKSLKRPKKSYNCPTCSKSFRGPKNLYQHKISHANLFYFCQLCEKKFKRSHGLKQHIKSIHEKEKSHVCPICDYAYLLKADMIKCRHSKLKKHRI